MARQTTLLSLYHVFQTSRETNQYNANGRGQSSSPCFFQDKNAKQDPFDPARSQTDLSHLSTGEATTQPRIQGIRQRLCFLCHDLRTFSSDPEVEKRLNSSVHAHFLGPPYLTEVDAGLAQTSPLSALQESADKLVPTATLLEFL